MHENAPNGSTQLPLKGAVLCSTSLDQDVRNILARVASDMGAVHRLDLTTDVTHLVVGNVNTPKYKHVAKERPDICVLKPDWIDAIRDAWTEGGDVDVESLVEQYRLPVFSDLQICVTGFEDLAQRQDLQSAVDANGATYHGDLTRTVTHLIAARPHGPKYDRARAWGLKIVSLKWFQESMERGMVLEESLYDPRIQFSDQGHDAFIRGYSKPSTSGKRNRAEQESALAQDSGKRKMRRTASTRLSSQSQSLWADMSGFEDQTTGQQTDQWGDASETLQHKDLAVQSYMSCEHADAPLPPQGNLAGPISLGPSVQHEERGLFSNIMCLVRGHNLRLSKKITQILTDNGAIIAGSPDDISDQSSGSRDTQSVLVLPSSWTNENKSSLPELPDETWRVTEWWIERCIEQKTILDPADDLLSQSHLGLTKHCLQRMTISTSGMSSKARHLSKLVEYAGATYSEGLTPNCSVLVVPALLNVNQTKLGYAAKYKIPVVFEEWLIQSIALGRKAPFTDYLIPTVTDPSREHRDNGRSASNDPVPQEAAKRKDDHQAQRLSVTRKRSVTPSLHLVKPRPLQTGSSLKIVTTSEAVREAYVLHNVSVPFVEEDDASVDDEAPILQDVQLDGAASQPLRELSPEVNSPPKRIQNTASESAKAERIVQPESPVEDTLTVPDEVEPAKQKDENSASVPEIEANNTRLDDEIKSLFARQKAAPAGVENQNHNQRRRRKDRKLGRALSNVSNHSAPSLRHNPSTEIADSTASASPLDVSAVHAEPPLPSQQLGYETLDAQEHRARMSKKMGTKLEGDGFGVRVESIGVVTDAESTRTGVGGRVRGRHRNAKD